MTRPDGLLTALLLTLSLSACTVPQQQEVTVFAASSLTDAFNEIAEAFEAAHPGVTVVLNYAGSSQLAMQIIEGAPADVFASANPAQMQNVIEAGLVAGTPETFASNRLTIITPVDNPAGIDSPLDLADPGVVLVLAVPGVPVREYTDDSLARLAADPAYGPAFPDAVYANLVSGEANVRLVASKVALGEADAGIVYTSDVTPDIADSVTQIEIPAEHNVTATYPVTALTDAPCPDLAADFIAFVRGREGQAILERWGFGPAEAAQ